MVVATELASVRERSARSLLQADREGGASPLPAAWYKEDVGTSGLQVGQYGQVTQVRL